VGSLSEVASRGCLVLPGTQSKLSQLLATRHKVKLTQLWTYRCNNHFTINSQLTVFLQLKQHKLSTQLD